MNEYPNLCPGCMKQISEDTVICPHCAHNCLSEQPAPYLAKKTVVVGRYIVGKVLYQTNNIVTYIAYDNIENTVVELNELLPKKLVAREYGKDRVTVLPGYEQVYHDCTESFEKLWRNLQSLQSPVVAGTVSDIFYSGATAYAVRDHIECSTLREYFSKRKNLLTFEKTMSVFMPVMSALEKLHRSGIIHGSISPENVLVRPDGKLRLAGFSADLKYTSEIDRILPTDGYSPIELYLETAQKTAATDVYSVAALMYTALTGIIPPRADKRDPSEDIVFPTAIHASVSASARAAFSDALKVIPAQRIGSFEIFKAQLASALSRAKQQEPPIPDPPAEKKEEPAKRTDDENTDDGKKHDAEEPSTLAIAGKVFVFTMLIIITVFCTLYTTVLYKYIEIPIIESVFGSFSFLPMNCDDTAHSSEPELITTENTTAAELLTVIDFTNMSYGDIKQNAVYNKNYTIEYQFHDSETVAADKVISQSINAGEKVEPGTKIIIVISSGMPKVTLRDVIGMKYEDAYNLLTQDGFVVKKNVLENDGAQNSGEVFTMSPVAGLEFEKGTQVTLNVWGPKPGEEETTINRIPGIFSFFGE